MKNIRIWRRLKTYLSSKLVPPHSQIRGEILTWRQNSIYIILVTNTYIHIFCPPQWVPQMPKSLSITLHLYYILGWGVYIFISQPKMSLTMSSNDTRFVMNMVSQTGIFWASGSGCKATIVIIMNPSLSIILLL